METLKRHICEHVLYNGYPGEHANCIIMEKRTKEQKIVFFHEKLELKGPKHEIFESGFFTVIRPVRVDDLGTGEKK